jgi:hypothetical protein
LLLIRAAGLYEAASAAGIYLTDGDALADAFSNPERMAEWTKAAEAHAVPVAALDALSFHVAGKLLSSRVIPKGAPNKGMKEAFQTAWRERPGDVLKGMGFDLGAQGAAGGWGEIAQGKGLNDIDTKAAAAEFFAEVAVQLRAASAGPGRAALPRDQGQGETPSIIPNIPVVVEELNVDPGQGCAAARPGQRGNPAKY